MDNPSQAVGRTQDARQEQENSFCFVAKCREIPLVLISYILLLLLLGQPIDQRLHTMLAHGQ